MAKQVNPQQSVYMPKSLPASIRPLPPSSLSSRSAAGPYSLASVSRPANPATGKAPKR